MEESVLPIYTWLSRGKWIAMKSNRMSESSGWKRVNRIQLANIQRETKATHGRDKQTYFHREDGFSCAHMLLPINAPIHPERHHKPTHIYIQTHVHISYKYQHCQTNGFTKALHQTCRHCNHSIFPNNPNNVSRYLWINIPRFLCSLWENVIVSNAYPSIYIRSSFFMK